VRRTIPRRAAAAGLLTLASAAPAWAEPGSTERVSVSSTGEQGNDNSFFPVMSADARYVAFVSKATNLIPGDTNHCQDIFVRDRKLGTTERVSVAADGTKGNDDSAGATITPATSPSGRGLTRWCRPAPTGERTSWSAPARAPPPRAPPAAPRSGPACGSSPRRPCSPPSAGR
jgi:hypothetical protein